MTKTCVKCKQTLSVADFNLNDNYKSGIDSQCMICSPRRGYQKSIKKLVDPELAANRAANNDYYHRNKFKIKERRILREIKKEKDCILK